MRFRSRNRSPGGCQPRIGPGAGLRPLATLVLAFALVLPCPGGAWGGSAADAAAVPGTGEPAQALAWRPYEAREFALALVSGRPSVLTFGAEWCAPCKELKARTFSAAEVVEAAQGHNLFYVDMTDGDGYTQLAQNSFEVRGAPTTIFFGADGSEVDRRGGFIPPDVFAGLLRQSAGRSEAD